MEDSRSLQLIIWKFDVMASNIKMTIYSDLSDSKNRQLRRNIIDKLNEIENKMSFFKGDSEVSLINRNAGKRWTSISDDTMYVIAQSKKISKISKGKFDITAGKLVDAWKISKGSGVVPNSEELSAILPCVDYNNILIDDNDRKVKLSQKDMMIDLGGIAKGFTADEIEKILRERNIKSVIINIGGNIKVLGKKIDGSKWRIGIQSPFSSRGNYIGMLSIMDLSIVTSGTYERYFESKGKTYHHILDTTTGYPVDNDIMSVTIISKKSIDADGLSTAVLVLGIYSGMNIINKLKDVEAIILTNDCKVFITDGLRERFYITDNIFKLDYL